MPDQIASIRSRPPLASALLCAAALLGAGVAAPARAADSLADALGSDSTVDLHFRTYYFDRLNPGDVTNCWRCRWR